MSSPLIWGGNGALLLQQGGINRSNGQVLQFNGAKNYLINPLAETGTITGWSLGTVSLTSAFPSGTPTFGSGASGNLALTATSTTPLSGTYSFSYASSAATTAGNFIASDAFTVDAADGGKPLTVQFYYQATSNGSNANWSGTSSNSFGVALYDVTAGGANWIMPAGVWGMTQLSGAGICTATFQSSVVAGQQYRLVVFNANATSNAITLYFDQLFVGPQTSPIGPVVTDWQSFTPTGSWSANSTYTGSYRRIGDSFQVQTKIALAGAPTSANLTINIPSGFTIDTTKLASSTQNQPALGVGGGKSAGVVANFIVSYNNTTSVVVQYLSSASTGAKTIVTQAAPATFASGDEVDVFYTIPIVGLSSNVQMSNDTDTRVVAARAHATGTQTPSNTQPANYNIIDFDTHAAFSTVSSGTRYTAPVSGYYLVSAALAVQNAGGNNIVIYKNGASYASGAIGSTGGYVANVGSTVVPLNAGEYVDIRITASVAVNASVDANYITVNRISGPAVIAATDSVNARYFASATSISGSLATIVWTTKDFDSTNSMSSGVYTIPVSGKYQINSSVAASGTYVLNNANTIEIQKNSTVVSRYKSYAGGVVTALSVEISDIISCNAGDTIRIQMSSSATGPAIVSSNFENYFSISRVGN